MSVEQEARQLGWVPQEEFRGNPDRWIDAESYLERGKTIMPILKENNRHMQAEIMELKGMVEQLTEHSKRSDEALATFKEFHVQNLKERLADTKASLLQQIRQAKEEGNLDQEVTLTDQLTEVNQQIKETAVATKESPKEKTDPPKTGTDPDSQAWLRANMWYLTDHRKHGLADGIASEIRNEDPEGKKFIGKTFYDELDRRMEEALAEASPTSKVGGSRKSGESSSGGSPGSFSSLPAEAQKSCIDQARKMVGEGKPFKTLDEWKSYFADLYVEE